MEYFYEFQQWLDGTRFYQEVLKQLPVPLNNIYFDSIFILCVAAYLLYRFLEAIHLALYRRRLRRRREKERKKELARQLEREKDMMYREMNVHQKEEKVNRFMDYMELLFASRGGHRDAYEYYDEYTDAGEEAVHDEVNNVKPDRKLKSRPKAIGRKHFLLGTSAGSSKKKHSETGYQDMMDAYEKDIAAEKVFSEQNRQKNKAQSSKLQELDEALQILIVDDVEFKEVETEDAPELMKRKEKARKAEEKERQKAERLERKRQKGAKHGRFGKAD